MSHYHLRIIAWICLIIMYLVIGIGVYFGAIELDWDYVMATGFIVVLYIIRFHWGKD